MHLGEPGETEDIIPNDADPQQVDGVEKCRACGHPGLTSPVWG